jgi:hypothetical protein
MQDRPNRSERGWILTGWFGLLRSEPKPAVQFARLLPEVDPEAPGDLENLR